MSGIILFAAKIDILKDDVLTVEQKVSLSEL